MKKIQTIIWLIPVFATLSCSHNETEPTLQTAKVQVKITHITHGIIPVYLQLTGKTVFLNKNAIVSPIAGYITKVAIRPGDRVQKNDTLFTLISQEVYALQSNDSITEDYGNISILAPISGVINQLSVFKKSVFVDKNASLCNIVETSSFFVETEVPYEYSSLVKLGNQCIIQFSDSTEYKAKFYKIMPTMNIKSQTQKVLTKIQNITSFIPENMIVKVLVEKSKIDTTQILSKNCVMTDALMTEFWVMKLINDTTAVQIPVKIGNQTHKQVEILLPQFSTNDKFISQGAYGLEDTTLVEVIK